MKQPLLTTAALILIIVSLVSPADVNTGHDVATTLVYHDSGKSTVSMLVEGIGDIGIKEARSLSDFGRVTTVAGRIAVLHTETGELPSIARLPFISTIERSWPLHVYLDKSVPDVGANAVWDQVHDSFGRNVTGNGVIIGFVDTGIDVSHPDFTFPNGTTKILYVWDQTTPGRPPPSFGYGYECNSADIQSGQCPENDTFGHGTHVAGIATSSGRATGNYTGVAPGASIIFVKSGNETCDGTGWTFNSSEILDGINYIVTKARQLGRRVVINLSLGGNIGGHDGSDPMEMALDQFVETGTPIVVAAGNDGQDNTHIQGRFTKYGNVTFNIISHQTTTDLAIDIWYSSQDDIGATLTTPTGRSYTVSASTGETTGTYGNVTTLGRSSDRGKELYFEVNSGNSLPTSNWRVKLAVSRVVSNGIWDAWVDTASCVSPGASFLPGSGYSIDQNDTIGIPGTAHDVVTVGAYVTKTSWKGLNDQVFGSTSSVTGGIASFSSRGPTRDGRIKPDVTAPGSVIASARSKGVARDPSDPDQFHRILAGTSMAAPHVSGTIALMLQYSPNLQAADIPSIIRETARQDSDTGLRANGSSSWGFGKIDARTATGLIRLTLIVNGLPVGVELPVQVDAKEIEDASDSWLYLYFPPGTTHTVTPSGSVTTNEGTQYELSNAELVVGIRNVEMPNHGMKTAIEYGPLNETTYLILNYAPTSATNPLILVLPLIVILALAIAVFLLAFNLYLIRRERWDDSTRT